MLNNTYSTANDEDPFLLLFCPLHNLVSALSERIATRCRASNTVKLEALRCPGKESVFTANTVVHFGMRWLGVETGVQA